MNSPLGKGLIGLAVIAALIATGDVSLHLILEIVHLIIEWAELGLDMLLEWALHLPGHTTQVLTAWIGVSFLALLSLWIIVKSLNALRAWWAELVVQVGELHESSSDWCREHRYALITVAGFLGLLMFFLV